MLVFGLVHGSGWEPPRQRIGATRGRGPTRKRREWDWHMVPWRALAWLALWVV